MIDIETLAKGPDALIMTIAAQQFDPFGEGWMGEELSLKLSVESQPNRAIDDDTIQWWAKQNPDAIEAAFSEDNRVHIEEALDRLHKIVWRSNRVWMQGPTFDAVILENAYNEFNKPLPWQFWKIRDSRSINSLVPSFNKKPVSHEALDDCRCQIMLTQEVLAYLKVKEMK